MYIEPVFNGLLYIYKDLSTFRKLNQPSSSKMPQKKKENFFLSKTVDQNNFPMDGISLFFEFEGIESPEKMSILRDFFIPIYNPDMNISQITPISLQVHFKTFHALKRYADQVQQIFIVSL